MATQKTVLKQIGQLLWGPAFIEPMAKFLECAGKSVRRYLAGERDIPATVFPALKGAMVKRRAELDEKISSMGD